MTPPIPAIAADVPATAAARWPGPGWPSCPRRWSRHPPGQGEQLAGRQDVTVAVPDGPASAEQAMRTEGLMMDPVYTPKALAMAPRGARAIFWHTGGVLDAVAAEEGRL